MKKQSHTSDGHAQQHSLGWFLCWAVVFADIGTSLYYVPGILYGEVGNLAGLFVLMSSVVFVLLSLKYIEITERYPEGGGVVTVATHAFGPWMGALGGMFITVDYFLTAAISSVSGCAYLNSIMPIASLIVPLSAAGVIFLGILNIIGIKESAKVTAVIATLAFIVDLLLVAVIATQVGPEGWHVLFSSLSRITTLGPWPILTGFAGSFLAFSGLESISQLSPAMVLPRKRTAGIAMGFVVVAILATSPLLTLFSTNLLTAKVPNGSETVLESVSRVHERETLLLKETNSERKTELTAQIEEGKALSERFISEAGAQYGGTLLKTAIVATASILLLFAANTAIIGAYHVFIALSRQNFLPQLLQKHNTRFGSPHWSVFLAVLPPVLIIVLTQGNVELLGQLYAFGLLGAFSLSSLGLDLVRWKEKKSFSLSFTLGLFTTACVSVAWVTNLYSKPLATAFGGSITVAGLIVAFLVRKYSKVTVVNKQIAETAFDKLPHGQILVPVFDEFDANLFEYAGQYAHHDKKEVVLLYLRDFTDVLQTTSQSLDQDEEGQEFLYKAVAILHSKHVKSAVSYVATSDMAETINEYRQRLKPELTILSPQQQSLLLNFLRGNLLKNVMKVPAGNVLIYTGPQSQAEVEEAEIEDMDTLHEGSAVLAYVRTK